MCVVSHARKAGDVSKGVLKRLEKPPGGTVNAQRRAGVRVAVVVAGELAERERADRWVEELSKRQCHLHSQLRSVY